MTRASAAPADDTGQLETALRGPDAPLASELSADLAPPPQGRDRARRHLCAADAELALLIRRTGRCSLRVDRAREPYESLIRAIAHQQLHGRAAEAILGRLLVLPGVGDGFPAPQVLLAAPPESLRGCGFSGGKVAAMRGVAEATLAGIVPSRRQAQRLDDAALIERLTSLRGIGRWTVEMLLIFSLGRPDIMPVDDFGVREGYRRIKRLERQPKPKELAEATQSWSPFRSVAAWYLWRAADESKPPEAANPMTK